MKEIRVAEIRAVDPAGDEADLYIEGRPIVFDTPTEIRDSFGAYTEIIKRGALDNADLSDSRLLYNHDLNRIPLARTPKTMELKVDPAGLSMRASLPDTQEARSIYKAIQRQDLSGMSFGFRVPAGGDEFDPETNTRTIHKIEKVYEVSVTPFPAYPTTSVEARTAIQSLKDPRRDELKIKINQILRREF